MKNRYLIDPDARRDLEQIFDYVTAENRSAAQRLMRAFRQRFRLLASQPLMGQARPELAPNLRSFSVGNYVFFFRPIAHGIAVARVLHGARDIDALFG